MVRGVRAHSGHRLPAIRSYMDDVTTLLQTVACTTRLLAGGAASMGSDEYKAS